MMGMSRDIYQSNILANNFSPEFNNLNIDSLNFMPYFEIKFLKTLNASKFDIYDTESIDEIDSANADGWDIVIPIDYTKLSRYIKI